MSKKKFICYDCGKMMVAQEFYKDTLGGVEIIVPCDEKNDYYKCECGSESVLMNLVFMAEDEYKRITGKEYVSEYNNEYDDDEIFIRNF